MATYNSNIMQAYADKKRIRTMNYHGTVTTTTCSIADGDWATSLGDIVYLTLVPFGAIFGSAKMVFSAATVLAFQYAIGIAGINPDGSFTQIADIIRDITPGVTAANTEQQLVSPPYWEQTIYQALWDNDTHTPIESFEPYADKPLGVLYAKCIARNDVALPFILNMEWVDPNPSSSPLISTAFKAAV